MKNDVKRNIMAPTVRVNWSSTGSSVLNLSIDILSAASVPGRDALIIGST